MRKGSECCTNVAGDGECKALEEDSWEKVRQEMIYSQKSVFDEVREGLLGG